MTRGYRNNNPGNLEKGSYKFIGEISGSDSRFRTFASMAWGFRAMFKILETYSKKYGLNTISGIIERYAPPSENPTSIYIDFVSSRSGIADNEKIYPGDKNKLVKIVEAIATFENKDAPNYEDVLKGWDLREVYKIDPPGSPSAPVVAVKLDKKKND